jgi:O-antigen ligase
MSTKNRIVRLIAVLAFFMSFNNILIYGTNLSMLVFITLFLYTTFKFQIIKIQNKIHYFVCFFGIAAIISCLDVNNPTIYNGLERSLIVLPNYIYWCFLIIGLTNLNNVINFLDFRSLTIISKYLAFGTLLTIVFYEYFSGSGISILNDNTPNSYAFMMVCFSSISVVYLYEYKKTIYSIVFFLIILSSLLFLERRAGFILVLISCLLSLNFESFNYRKILNSFFIALILTVILQLDIVKSFIFDSSSRVYETIYESGNIKTKDQSYLTRLAQVEKGITLFKEHPLTGIGLNNFSVINVNILGNFKGAELIIHKRLDNKSAHNSYISLLAEGGLLIVIPFSLILLFNIYYFVVYYNKRTKLENSYYWSFIAMLIHLYFISELYNVFAWFLIALVSCLSLKYAKLYD